MSRIGPIELVKKVWSGEITLSQLAMIILFCIGFSVVFKCYCELVAWLLSRNVPTPTQLARTQNERYESLTPQQKGLVEDLVLKNPSRMVAGISLVVIGFLWILYVAESVMKQTHNTVGWETYLTIGLAEVCFVSFATILVLRFKRMQKQILSMFNE